ncbi:protein involved in C cytochrome biogenesis [Anopheles sinensis]|uniref:Protein involved in C cytochrome biogenesis n=1 Tax=Anopheles sinensis TaxID=74873 RepID=A0A084VHS9_ANOSI|nr:protein involved in C cytochrome biogenesis [Anopheles sinensis]
MTLAGTDPDTNRKHIPSHAALPVASFRASPQRPAALTSQPVGDGCLCVAQCFPNLPFRSIGDRNQSEPTDRMAACGSAPVPCNVCDKWPNTTSERNRVTWGNIVYQG